MAGKKKPLRLTGCLAAAVLALTVTACGQSQDPTPEAPASEVTPTDTPQAAAPSSATPTTAAATATPQTAAGSAAVPTLGRATVPSSKGYGQVRPTEIDNGGDSTGIVSKVHWTAWGGAQATGDGTASYVPEGKASAEGRQEPAHIVAYQLGTCQGKLMYQRITWYFPGQGESFDPKRSRNICTGD